MEDIKITKTPSGLVCVFELTHKCNLQCRHCYIVRKRSKSNKELSTNKIKYILDKIYDSGCVWVKFTGGEPFLREDFAEIYSYAKKKMRVSILTNATLLTSKLINLFSEHPPYNIEVSIYGISENTYRRFCRLGDAYYDSSRALEIFSKKRLNFEIKTTVTKINKNDIAKIRDLALNYGCNFKYNATLYPRIDGGWFPSDVPLAPQEIVDFDLDENLSGNKTNAWVDLYSKFIHKDRLMFIYTCVVGNPSFSIDPLGNMNICHMFPRKPSYNLLRGAFKYGWAILNIMSKQKINLKRRCAKCKIYFLCHKCHAMDNPTEFIQSTVFDYYCNIAKLRFKKLKELCKK